jgi:hypothetical protein
MGWVKILVCDGCLERIEPDGIVPRTTTAEHQDALDCAKSRRWTKAGPKASRRYYCANCTRVLRDNRVPQTKVAPLRRPAMTVRFGRPTIHK